MLLKSIIKRLKFKKGYQLLLGATWQNRPGRGNEHTLVLRYPKEQGKSADAGPQTHRPWEISPHDSIRRSCDPYLRKDPQKYGYKVRRSAFYFNMITLSLIQSAHLISI